MDELYVQYGCGLCAPANWRNFDASFTLRLQRLPLVGRCFKGGKFPIFPGSVEYGDIVKGLPLPNESCRGIYCSHVLEHLALEELPIALRNTCSYLKKDGVFRFVLPDLAALAARYVQSSDEKAAVVFMEQSRLGKKRRPRGLAGVLREWLGSSAHLWMWDFRSIAPELARAGFRDIRRAQLGDSVAPRFKEVEEPERWEGCLGVECIR